MALTLLLLALAIFLIAGVPISFALLSASVLTLVYLDIAPVIAVQQLAAGINVFSLMAIPFFIFAGDLMYRSGIAEKLLQVADAALGRLQGGLGQVDVGASMLFGAVSGSSIASVSALGSSLMPAMQEKGYDKDYAVNVTCCAAILGVIIPPSHNMIIYAASSGLGISIGDLFLAGIFPGIIAGIALAITAWIIARKRNYPKGVFPGWPAFLKASIIALPGLFTAVIIVVGILGGVFTPTESSAVAIVYTLIVAAFVYRTLTPTTFALACRGAVQTTAIVMMIIGSAAVFGWLLALLHAPTQLAQLVMSISDNPTLVMLMVILVLLILGTFMDMAPLIIITTPIFLPMMMELGVDPVHFGIVLILTLGIGLVTPPVGSVLFVGAAIGDIKIEETVKTIWPFYLALIAALLLTAYIPSLTLFLPSVFQ